VIPALIDSPSLPAMSVDALEKVRRVEACLMEMPQADIPTAHLLHAGLYARTIRIPAGVVLTGALIKLATVLVLSGRATVYTGNEALELCGYHVLPASAGRKQVFVAHEDTDLTMLFPSTALSVEDAEAEFTDEAHLLLSRRASAFTGD
jgi:hypothetical protein